MIITVVVVPMVITTTITILPMPEARCDNQDEHRAKALVMEQNKHWHQPETDKDDLNYKDDLTDRLSLQYIKYFI